MLLVILGIYGVAVWLVLYKLKLLPVNKLTKSAAAGLGVVLLVAIFLGLQLTSPYSKDTFIWTYTIEIRPETTGRVTAVSVVANTPIRKGAPLFTVDATSYQNSVDRLQAQLASAQSGVGQLRQNLQAAHAAVAVTHANLTAAEGKVEESARQTLEAAKAQVRMTRANLAVAEMENQRVSQAAKKKAVSEMQVDESARKVESLKAQLDQASAQEKQAELGYQASGEQVNALREQARQAEAQERAVLIGLEAESSGENASVAQVRAQLRDAQYDLENTTVRAPVDGYVVALALRPGAFISLRSPVMSFVAPDQWYVIVNLRENALGHVKPGQPVEVALDNYPGRVFEGEVETIVGAVGQGQFSVSGQMPDVKPGPGIQFFPVKVKIKTPADVTLRPGARGAAVIYTDSLKPLRILRKVQIRIKSLLDFVYL
jgi:multidrug resistance efflux pump